MQLILLIVIAVVAVYFITGGDYGTGKIFGPPDTLPLSRYDDIDVNVHFYLPDQREVYLGQTRGASSCGDMAHNYAARNGLTGNPSWGYVCCTIEDGSSCYRKIR